MKIIILYIDQNIGRRGGIGLEALSIGRDLGMIS